MKLTTSSRSVAKSLIASARSAESSSIASRSFASSSVTKDVDTGRGSARDGDTSEESWKRNMNEARIWRRNQAETRKAQPFFLPKDAKTPPKRTAKELTLSTLLATGAALGHSTSMLAPPYTPYIFGSRSGLSIIDLEQTLPILRRVSGLVRDVVEADGVVLFVGTREGLRKSTLRAAERLQSNGYAVAEKWLPGTLTNSETFFGLEPLEANAFLPDLVIFLNPSENLGAIRECTSRNVPTVGIVDTDTDPRIVTYAIPANMESVRTAELIVGTLSMAGADGRQKRLAKEEAAAKANSKSKRH